MRIPVLFAVGLCLAACGNPQSNNNGTATATAAGGDQSQIALGLTERQLLDADLVDGAGQELGDVEGLVRDSAGAVTQLLVEVEDSSPDRYVHVPIEGLSVIDNRGDRDLRVSMTRDQIMALPAVTR